MKRFKQKLKLSSVLFLVSLITFAFVSGSKDIIRPVETKITLFNWNHVIPTFEGNNYSYFEFYVEYEIYNPNPHPVTFTLPYCNLAFLPNISISLENDTIEYIPPGYIGVCMIGEKTVKPGITTESRLCTLIFKEEGISELPNGEYHLWVYLYGAGAIISYVTILTITNSETITNTSITKSFGSNIVNLILISSMTLILGYIIRIRRKDDI
jgi:hypothetical protein